MNRTMCAAIVAGWALFGHGQEAHAPGGDAGSGAGDAPKDLRGFVVKPADIGLSTYDSKRIHALVIGINNYSTSSDWRNLYRPAADAKAIADVLETQYQYGSVHILLNEDATRGGIINAMKEYAHLGSEDSLLVYYAGHGWMDKDRNVGYWIPHDAKKGQIETYISATEIMSDFLLRYRIKHLLIVSDSCFAGTLVVRGGDEERTPDWTLPVGFHKSSRYALTSGNLEAVPDESIFSTRLLQQLRSSDEPAFGVQDLYHYIRQTVKSALCERLKSDDHMLGGEFVFVRLAGATAVPRTVVVVPKDDVVEPTTKLPDQTSGGTGGKTKSGDDGSGLYVGLRAGASSLTGVAGVEAGLPHWSINAGIIPGWTVVGGVRYCLTPGDHDSWWLAVAGGQRSESDDELAATLFGAMGGYRWRMRSNWSISLGVGAGMLSEDGGDSVPAVLWDAAVGYTF